MNFCSMITYCCQYILDYKKLKPLCTLKIKEIDYLNQTYQEKTSLPLYWHNLVSSIVYLYISTLLEFLCRCTDISSSTVWIFRDSLLSSLRCSVSLKKAKHISLMLYSLSWVQSPVGKTVFQKVSGKHNKEFLRYKNRNWLSVISKVAKIICNKGVSIELCLYLIFTCFVIMF